MKYKVQLQETKETRFVIFMVASNGENCKRMASCADEKDANLLCSLLNILNNSIA